MRVLSIDLDYIMDESIELYGNIGWDDIPSIRWNNYYNHIKEEKIDVDLYINEKNLFYCFDVFLKAINNCHNVIFAFNHDSILDELSKYGSIDLINIDHHDDVIYGDNLDIDDPNYSINSMINLYKKYDSISSTNMVHEGNWISFLNINKQINSYTFIGNDASINFSKEKENFIKKHISKFEYYTKDNYTFKNYKFDHIFVCLSPQYIPPCHWHYFTMFLSAYKSITGKSYEIDEMAIRKFSTNCKYSDVIEKISTEFGA
jgi:hypothetical protein